MTQRVAALFDSLEQHIQQGRRDIANLQQRLAALESENRQLHHSLAKRVDALRADALTVRESTEPEAPEQDAHRAANRTTNAERGDPLPRRTAPPMEVPRSEAGMVHSEAARQAGDKPQDDAGPQSQLAVGEAPSPQALLDEWYRRYTDTFFKGHTRPLKVGIHEDLVANEPWPDKLVRRALACYVNLPRYLKAVRAGAERVDLAGEPAGTVTPGEARHAHKKLEALQAQQRKRDKAAQQKVRQNPSARLDRKLGDLLAKHGKH